MNLARRTKEQKEWNGKNQIKFMLVKKENTVVKQAQFDAIEYVCQDKKCVTFANLQLISLEITSRSTAMAFAFIEFHNVQVYSLFPLACICFCCKHWNLNMNTSIKSLNLSPLEPCT